MDNESQPTVQHTESPPMLCDDLNGKEIQVRGIYVYTFIYIADSLGSTAETNSQHWKAMVCQ